MPTKIARAAVHGVLSFVLVSLAAPGSAQTTDAVKDQHAAIGVEEHQAASPAAKATDTGWYHQAGLGMFLHWGLSAVEAKHELSWAMMANIDWNENPLTPETYFKLADRFQPEHYEPQRWLRAAKEAGFGYVVLTTRHHDGYALWPSKYGDFSTRTHMNGRDLLRPYVDACREVGLKVGFYYSPPDWHFNRHYLSFGYNSKGTAESPHLGTRHEPIQLPAKPVQFEQQYINYLNGQVTELMSNYGKVDLLWFDGSAGSKVMTQTEIRRLQPGILINDRQHGDGDFTTKFEVGLPQKRPDGLWEHCFSMVGSWGYTEPETWLPATRLLVRLVRCRAWGGNVLVNFAPRADGQMSPRYYQCLADIQTWMARCGESVIGVEAGPWPQRSNVPVTVRGNIWYLHLVPATRDGTASPNTVVLRGVNKPQRVTMLATGRTVEHRQDLDQLTIDVRQESRTPLVDVIKVDW